MHIISANFPLSANISALSPAYEPTSSIRIPSTFGNAAMKSSNP